MNQGPGADRAAVPGIIRSAATSGSGRSGALFFKARCGGGRCEVPYRAARVKVPLVPESGCDRATHARQMPIEAFMIRVSSGAHPPSGGDWRGAVT